MKPVLFVICFALGVSLMVFSGYIPQAASAHGRNHDGTSANPALDASGQPLRRTVTRRVLASENAEATAPAVEPAIVSPAENQPTEQDTVAVPPANAPHPNAVTPNELASPQTAAPPKTGEPELQAAPTEKTPVVAEAGPGRTFWVGWDELPLDGSASTGAGLTYHWRQTAGPVSLAINNDAQAVATASGLLGSQHPTWRGATYEFELTVTDATGEQSVDRVKHVVQSAPLLRIKPAPERHFESHDGYELAHFVVWTTILDSYEATIEISSPVELTFTKVTGGNCELTGGKTDGGYVYQVVVYGQAGEPTSWAEFLVDTEDKVPAIVQLGVSWENR